MTFTKTKTRLYFIKIKTRFDFSFLKLSDEAFELAVKLKQFFVFRRD